MLHERFVGLKVNRFTPSLDYWQIFADKGIISIYNPFSLLEKGLKVQTNASTIKKKIVGMEITDIQISEEHFNILLSSNITIQVSLRDEDYVGPEAIEIVSGELIEVVN